MLEIRSAALGDADGIRNVHISAFVSNLEADLVERLIRDGDALISIVAIDGGAIVGHILFSRMSVDADGGQIEALGLAPVAVLPSRQREGIGTKLIEAGLREASSLGTEMVFLVGEPDYYRRFGFDAETAKPFASPYAGEYFQAKPMTEDFALPESGRAEYATAFAELE